MRGKFKTEVALTEGVTQKILFVRGQKVLLDADLARLYGVETKSLLRAVKRNAKRFPKDFMFQLAPEELAFLRYQIGTAKTGRGGRRTRPYVFTEQGIAMLSSVLNSDRAVQVNIAIMRADSKKEIGFHVRETSPPYRVSKR